MVDLGAALFASVGAWTAVTWISAGPRQWRALFCAAAMVASCLVVAMYLQALVPALMGTAIGAAARLLLPYVAARLKQTRLSKFTKGDLS